MASITRNISDKPHATSIPIDLQDLLVKLNFISMIQAGQKLNANTMSFSNNNTYLQMLIASIRRTINVEDRNTTLNYLNDTINLTIDAINKYSDSEFLRNIINSLNAARIGISRLEATYQNDPGVISKLRVYLANIDVQLNKYRHLIQGCEELNA